MQIEPGSAFVDGRLRGSFVYMLLCKSEEALFVKIGVSDNPTTRLSELLVGCPVEPLLFSVAHIPTRTRAELLERVLQRSVQKWSTRGEWFSLKVSESAAFKATWRAALKHYDKPAWPVRWTTISIAALRKLGQLRIDAGRRKPKRKRQIGRPHQDFRTHASMA